MLNELDERHCGFNLLIVNMYIRKIVDVNLQRGSQRSNVPSRAQSQGRVS